MPMDFIDIEMRAPVRVCEGDPLRFQPRDWWNCGNDGWKEFCGDYAGKTCRILRILNNQTFHVVFDDKHQKNIDTEELVAIEPDLQGRGFA
jgi:hypothetical protein